MSTAEETAPRPLPMHSMQMDLANLETAVLSSQSLQVTAAGSDTCCKELGHRILGLTDLPV